MKKTKVKYHNSVPQEIIDLMGDHPYVFIKTYNSYSWRQSWINNEPELKTTIVSHCCATEFLEGSFEDAIVKLQNKINDPNYISGSFYEEYGYDDVCLNYVQEMKYTPTEKELAEYVKAKKIYDEEFVIWSKLKKIIDSIVKAEKETTRENKIKELEKQLAKLKKES